MKYAELSTFELLFHLQIRERKQLRSFEAIIAATLAGGTEADTFNSIQFNSIQFNSIQFTGRGSIFGSLATPQFGARMDTRDRTRNNGRAASGREASAARDLRNFEVAETAVR
jgi:hypothetical protein